jgi:hypothetical protein
VHGAEKKSLERFFPRAKRLLGKIVIPGRACEDLREALEDYGMDEVRIFPDLEGLGKSVSRWLAQNVGAPHDGLYTRLQASPIHGVGVFAIKDIKKGRNLFTGDSDEMLWVNSDLLPKERDLRKLYDDFAVVKNDAKEGIRSFGCPPSFHRLTMSWYLNDPKPGEKPNVRCDDNLEFWSLRDIKRGEELTVDSRTYSDHESPKVKAKRNPRKGIGK